MAFVKEKYFLSPMHGFILYNLGPQRIRTFYQRKPIFTKKNIQSVCGDFLAVQMNDFVRRLFERYFQARYFSFWITEGIMVKLG
jgi:hypothetical protein